MAAHRVTHSWAPNFGFKLVAAALRHAPEAAASYDLTCVARLMNAGEQVTSEACEAFLAATGLLPSVMQPAFGMAEVSTCMAYNHDYDRAPDVRVLKVSLGEPTLRLAPPHAAELLTAGRATLAQSSQDLVSILTAST